MEKVRRTEGGKRFSFDFAPYQREIFRSFFDPANEVTVAAIYSRGGKTLLASGAVGYSLKTRPRRIVVGYPANNQAEGFSKDGFQVGLVNPTPELAEILPDGSGRRLGNNTIHTKQFPGGQIDFVGVNSGLRTVKGNLVWGDEIDAFTSEKSDEGDKTTGLLGRADEYPDAIKILTSYPFLKGKSAIWHWARRIGLEPVDGCLPEKRLCTRIRSPSEPDGMAKGETSRRRSRLPEVCRRVR